MHSFQSVFHGNCILMNALVAGVQGEDSFSFMLITHQKPMTALPRIVSLSITWDK